MKNVIGHFNLGFSKCTSLYVYTLLFISSMTGYTQICEVKMLSYDFHKSDGWIKDESLNISVDGSKMVYAASKHVVIMDRHYGGKKDMYELNTVSCTAIDEFGKTLAVAVDNKINIYNADDLEKLTTVENDRKMYNMAFFGNTLVGSANGTIYCFRKTGELVYKRILADSLITFSIIRRINDEIALLLAGNKKDEKLIKFNVLKNEIISEYKLEYDAIDIEVSPDSKYIGIIGSSERNYFVEVRMLNTYTLHYTYASEALYMTFSLSFSPDSRYLAVANSSNTNHVYILDITRKISLGSIYLGILRNIYHSIDGISGVQFDRKSNSLFAAAVETIVNYQLQCIY